MSDFNAFITAIKKDDDVEFTPRDFLAVFAIDASGEGVVLAESKDCRDCDLFTDGWYFSDNGVALNKSLNIGLYIGKFRPWAHTDYNGEYDCGIDVTDIELIALAPVEFLMEKIKK